MRRSLLRKLSKYDPVDLLCWASAGQLFQANREKVAKVEYALGVVLSLDYEKRTKNKRISRDIIRRLFYGVSSDFQNSLRNLYTSELQTFFPMGYLSIRGEGFPWQMAQAS